MLYQIEIKLEGNWEKIGRPIRLEPLEKVKDSLLHYVCDLIESAYHNEVRILPISPTVYVVR